MKQLPPLNDEIIFALARTIDDSQTDRRDPSHSDLDHCISNNSLSQGDPKSHGQTVGKAKRLRSVLMWALEEAYDNGRGFVAQFVSLMRSCGSFRQGSPNYVGDEAIVNLRGAMAAEGYSLTTDGMLEPKVLDSMSGVELTEALYAYVRRAQRGSQDAALLVGTGKDLLEAISAHVLCECYGSTYPASNFPQLLGSAFIALGKKTSADKVLGGETPQNRLERALFDAACAVNTMRNKQGTGHGRPWLPEVRDDEARHVVQVMGIVGELLLNTLKNRNS